MGIMLVPAAAGLEEGTFSRLSAGCERGGVGAVWHDLSNSLRVGMSTSDYPHSATIASSTNHIAAGRDGRLSNAPPWPLWIHPQVLD